jgi:hypothetical protein
MTRIRFTAVLRPIEGGTYVDFPSEAVEALRATGRTSVVGTIDGQPFKNQFMPYVFEGEGRKVVMGINKATRTPLGKDAGDTVEFDLERDERSRSADVIVPLELVDALDQDPAAKAAFAALAPSHRHEYAEFVAGAKRLDTRLRRAAQTVAELRG